MTVEQQREYNRGTAFFRSLFPFQRQQMMADDGWDWRDFFDRKPSPAFFAGFDRAWQEFQCWGTLL